MLIQLKSSKPDSMELGFRSVSKSHKLYTAEPMPHVTHIKIVQNIDGNFRLCLGTSLTFNQPLRCVCVGTIPCSVTF